MKKQIEQTLTSLEVAEMIEKEHKNLMRDIRNYIGEFNQLKIEPVNFFTESVYIDNKNQERPCFKITKQGCEFIAHKLTGIKGTEFTAKYIERFHDMEDTIKTRIQQQVKPDRTRIMEMNARTRMAQTYIKLSQVETLSKEYKNILVSKATEVLSGEQLLPLPKSERKVYSAKEIGEIFGISSNMVGRIANKNNLKVEEYGEYRKDITKNLKKDVDTWVYYETVIPVFKKILS